MFRTCEYLNIIPLPQKLCWVLSEWLLYSEGRIPRVPTPNSSLKTCRCPLAGEGVIWVTEYRNWTLVWPVDTLVDNLCKLQSHKGYQNVIFFCHILGRQVILPAAPQLFGVAAKPWELTIWIQCLELQTTQKPSQWDGGILEVSILPAYLTTHPIRRCFRWSSLKLRVRPLSHRKDPQGTCLKGTWEKSQSVIGWWKTPSCVSCICLYSSSKFNRLSLQTPWNVLVLWYSCLCFT